jgi:hypothetical protein
MNSYRLSQTKKEKKKPTSDVFIIDITKWTGSNSAFHMLRNYVIENTKICSIKQLRNIMATIISFYTEYNSSKLIKCWTTKKMLMHSDIWWNVIDIGYKFTSNKNVDIKFSMHDGHVFLE